MADDRPVLSVIVVSWNTRELVRETLAAVFESRGVAIEVLVVDNASTDGTVAMVRDGFPEVQLTVNATNRGFAAANNQALLSARGEYAVLLNSDAVVPPDGLRQLAKVMETHPRAGLLGPTYVYPDGRFQASFADFPTLWRQAVAMLGLGRWLLPAHYPSHGPGESRSARAVDWVPGTCLMARLAAVAEVGPLDEGYYFYGEELDWCRRMWGAGWEVWFDPSVVVRHHLGQSAERTGLERVGNLYRGQLRYFARYKGWLPAALLKLCILASLVLRAGRQAASGRSRRQDRRRELAAAMRAVWGEPVRRAAT